MQPCHCVYCILAYLVGTNETYLDLPSPRPVRGIVAHLVTNPPTPLHIGQVLLVNTDAQNLSFFVYANNTISRLMLSGDKNSLATNAIHVDTGTGFQVIQMYESIFGDEINDAKTSRHLHIDGEIIHRLSRKEYLHGLFQERGIDALVVNFNYMQLVPQVS